jgi:hypothetical protein
MDNLKQIANNIITLPTEERDNIFKNLTLLQKFKVEQILELNDIDSITH